MTFDESLDPTVLVQLIAIHGSTAHASGSAAATASTAAKPEKVKRPMISAAGTSEEYAYVLQRWEEYKQACRLSGSDVVLHLLECCDEPLRKDLTRLHGSLANKSEREVLNKIKSLAIRAENVMVARVQLHVMTQDRDEPVRAFAARLKGQASVCQFSVKCTACETQTDYSESIVRDALVRGLYDEDIRLEVLGNPDLTNKSLELTTALIEAKESGKRSASRLNIKGTEITTSAGVSSYQKQNKNRQPWRHNTQTNNSRGTTGTSRPSSIMNNNHPPVDTCGYCGQVHARPNIARVTGVLIAK